MEPSITNDTIWSVFQEELASGMEVGEDRCHRGSAETRVHTPGPTLCRGVAEPPFGPSPRVAILTSKE